MLLVIIIILAQIKAGSHYLIINLKKSVEFDLIQLDY